MFYKKIENDNLVSVIETNYLINMPEYEKITKKEYLDIKSSLESGCSYIYGESTAPTYSELSEACSILMGGEIE